MAFNKAASLVTAIMRPGLRSDDPVSRRIDRPRFPFENGSSIVTVRRYFGGHEAYVGINVRRNVHERRRTLTDARRRESRQARGSRVDRFDVAVSIWIVAQGRGSRRRGRSARYPNGDPYRSRLGRSEELLRRRMTRLLLCFPSLSPILPHPFTDRSSLRSGHPLYGGEP